MSNNFFLLSALFLALSLTALCPAQYVEWPLPEAAGESLWLEANGDQLRDYFIFNNRTISVWFGNEKNGFAKEPSLRVQFPDRYACFAIDALNSNEVKSIYAMSRNGVDVMRLTAANPLGSGDDRAVLNKEPVFEPVVRHSTNVAPAPGRIDRVDFLIDLNGDGTCEILLPGKTGFIVLQQQEGGWSPLVEIGGLNPPRITLEGYPKGTEHFFGQHFALALWPGNALQGVFPQTSKPSFYRFSAKWPLSTLRIADANQDDRLDLSSSLQIAEQTATGSFRLSEQNPFTSPSLDNGFFLGGEFGSGFCDVDGDGRLDMVEAYTEGQSFSPKTRIKVWLDIRSAGAQERKPLVMRTSDILPDYRDLTQRVMQDLDDDGDLDIYLMYIDHIHTSAEANLKAFWDKGIRGELRFYLWEKNTGYPKKAAFSFPLIFRYDIFGLPELENLPFRVGHDFDGDGRADLLHKSGANELSVHRFLGPQQGFTARPWRVFQLPENSKIINFEACEISRDNRTDLTVTVSDPDDPKHFPMFVFYSSKQ